MDEFLFCRSGRVAEQRVLRHGTPPTHGYEPDSVYRSRRGGGGDPGEGGEIQERGGGGDKIQTKNLLKKISNKSLTNVIMTNLD